MERDTNEYVSYGDFTRIIRDAAQVDATVCHIFNLPIRRIVKGDFQDYMNGNLGGSYVRLRSRFSIDEFVERSRSDLLDYVLDTVEVPSDAEANMDWEDFNELVETVINAIWEQVRSINRDGSITEIDYLEAI